MFDSANALESFGYSVSTAGDVNGDGHDDLIIGAPSYQDSLGSNVGRAIIVSGLDGALLYEYFGASAEGRFGETVSDAGDVNNDGHSDFIIASGSDDTNGRNAGIVNVYSGFDGSLLHAIAGETPGDALGRAVDSAGDINGDGYDDFIVGVPGDDNPRINSGKAVVYSGLDGSVLQTSNGVNAYGRYGIAVSGLGDINGDGHNELVVGESGFGLGHRAWVISGLRNSVLYRFNDNSTPERTLAGISVSDAGDVNNDGVDDIVVGWPFASSFINTGGQPSEVRVFSGADGSQLHVFFGSGRDQAFGFSVSGVGDVNSDGHDDILIGATEQSLIQPDGPGSFSLYSGLDGSLLLKESGLGNRDQLGFSVSDAGDVNNDGIPDFIVGATRGEANDSGYATIYSGAQ